MLRVYVAGAYSGTSIHEVFENMRRGLRLATAVLQAGFAPYVPWEDFQRHMLAEFPIEVCYAYSIEWLRVSQAVIVQPVRADQSKGTQDELAEATRLEIPVFWTMKELKAWRYYLPVVNGRRITEPVAAEVGSLEGAS